MIADAHIQKQGDPGKRTQGALVRRGFLQVLGGQKLPESAKAAAGWSWPTGSRNRTTR